MKSTNIPKENVIERNVNHQSLWPDIREYIPRDCDLYSYDILVNLTWST